MSHADLLICLSVQCTCRPYLIFGIEEAVKEAQNGGSGVVIYFRKEGRALGEVTKYLVYNARKPYKVALADIKLAKTTSGKRSIDGNDKSPSLHDQIN
jgi:GTP cyclohydrolase II